jgi:hypothetical protein
MVVGGSAIVSRIIPMLQHSTTPPLRLRSITDYLYRVAKFPELLQGAKVLVKSQVNGARTPFRL